MLHLAHLYPHANTASSGSGSGSNSSKYLTCKRGSVGQSEGLSIPRSSVRFRLKPDPSNSHEFELHRPSNKGTKLLLKVIKAIIIIVGVATIVSIVERQHVCAILRLIHVVFVVLMEMLTVPTEHIHVNIYMYIYIYIYTQTKSDLPGSLTFPLLPNPLQMCVRVLIVSTY